MSAERTCLECGKPIPAGAAVAMEIGSLHLGCAPAVAERLPANARSALEGAIAVMAKEVPLAPGEAFCGRCEGCGRIANMEPMLPWTHYMKTGMDRAGPATFGVLRPVPCPECQGTGRKRSPIGEPEDRSSTTVLPKRRRRR